jgi:hypothetical protein
VLDFGRNICVGSQQHILKVYASILLGNVYRKGDVIDQEISEHDILG